MDIVAFEVEHLKRLRVQPAQQSCLAYLTEELLADAVHMDAYTALVDGAPVAVAGLMDFWPGRAMAWSYIGEGAGLHMVRLTRAIRNFLDGQEIRRIEAYVDPDFEAGLRWIELLGFTREGRLRAFMPDGRDTVIFARVRR